MISGMGTGGAGATGPAVSSATSQRRNCARTRPTFFCSAAPVGAGPDGPTRRLIYRSLEKSARLAVRVRMRVLVRVRLRALGALRLLGLRGLAGAGAAVAVP